MKTVNATLSAYLRTKKQFITFDAYDLGIMIGNTRRHVYLTDAPVNIEDGGHTYIGRQVLLSRDDTSITSQLSVDSLKVTLNVEGDDTIKINNQYYNWMTMANEGTLDESTLQLSRLYFNAEPDQYGNHNYVGKVDLFFGDCSVSEVSTLEIDLEVKSTATQLSYEFPTRRFYPSASYATINGVVKRQSSDDNRSCMIPLKPSQTVLFSL